MTTQKKEWHLDRKYSIGIIIAILVQATSVIISSTEMKSDIKINKTNIQRVEKNTPTIDDRNAMMERIQRAEEENKEQNKISNENLRMLNNINLNVAVIKKTLESFK